LFGYYPAFKTHLPILEKADIIQMAKNSLKWNRNTIALGQYFEYLECIDKRYRWSVVEKTFGLKPGSLRTYVLNQKISQHEKPSKDWEEVKKLLGI
jgi:hypothetical protein